jgi:hypothetical protein
VIHEQLPLEAPFIDGQPVPRGGFGDLLSHGDGVAAEERWAVLVMRSLLPDHFKQFR